MADPTMTLQVKVNAIPFYTELAKMSGLRAIEHFEKAKQHLARAREIMRRAA